MASSRVPLRVALATGLVLTIAFGVFVSVRSDDAGSSDQPASETATSAATESEVPTEDPSMEAEEQASVDYLANAAAGYGVTEIDESNAVRGQTTIGEVRRFLPEVVTLNLPDDSETNSTVVDVLIYHSPEPLVSPLPLLPGQEGDEVETVPIENDTVLFVRDPATDQRVTTAVLYEEIGPLVAAIG